MEDERMSVRIYYDVEDPTRSFGINFPKRKDIDAQLFAAELQTRIEQVVRKMLNE